MPHSCTNAPDPNPLGGTGMFLAGYVVGKHARHRVAGSLGCLGLLIKGALFGYAVWWCTYWYLFK